ncbi:MAG: hypothetical protein D4R65_10035 [Verrucomicrobiaceae bacterium]|nr:MAG: hypothetical protein D4R65_10035 [Verrucomicrobiaceae bacterium]
MNILKVVVVSILAVVGFVAGVLAEAIIELRRVILPCLVVMGLLWFWMLNDPHRPRTRPFRVDSAPGWMPR